MPKTNQATKKRPTNFEQVPLEVVKKIAAEDAPSDHTATDEVGDVPATTTMARSVPGPKSRRNRR